MHLQSEGRYLAELSPSGQGANFVMCDWKLIIASTEVPADVASLVEDVTGGHAPYLIEEMMDQLKADEKEAKAKVNYNIDGDRME